MQAPEFVVVVYGQGKEDRVSRRALEFMFVVAGVVYKSELSSNAPMEKDGFDSG